MTATVTLGGQEKWVIQLGKQIWLVDKGGKRKEWQTFSLLMLTGVDFASRTGCHDKKNGDNVAPLPLLELG